MGSVKRLLKISAFLIVGIVIVIVITYFISACTKTGEENMIFDIEPETVIYHTFNN